MLNSSADEANSVLRNYQIGSARQTSRLPQEMRYKPWWWPVDAVNGDQLFFAIKLSNTLSFSLQKRLHVTVKSGQLALQTRWQSSLILIKLDFHSTKWTLWLVDSWSRAPDQIDHFRVAPLFQNESKCETFHMKMSSACGFIFMQIKVIFIRVVSHLDSLWNRGTRELGSGLLP